MFTISFAKVALFMSILMIDILQVLPLKFLRTHLSSLKYEITTEKRRKASNVDGMKEDKPPKAKQPRKHSSVGVSVVR